MSNLKRTVFGASGAFSRLLHALLFNGDTDMTTSARMYIEGQTSEQWDRVRRVIDLLFFFQENHCESAWQLEVENSRRTLSKELERTLYV